MLATYNRKNPMGGNRANSIDQKQYRRDIGSVKIKSTTDREMTSPQLSGKKVKGNSNSISKDSPGNQNRYMTNNHFE